MILPLLACLAIDGDTLRCGDERVRLLGIDAPETRRCPRNRVCVPGDGRASKANLERLLTGPAEIERVGRDRYGRTLARVTVGGVDLSCAQIRGGYAAYIARWDNERRVARVCF